jgi:transposase
LPNQRGTRMKVLLHDGQGLWLLARRLHQGRFVWSQCGLAAHIELNPAQ